MPLHALFLNLNLCPSSPSSFFAESGQFSGRAGERGVNTRPWTLAAFSDATTDFFGYTSLFSVDRYKDRWEIDISNDLKRFGSANSLRSRLLIYD